MGWTSEGYVNNQGVLRPTISSKDEKMDTKQTRRLKAQQEERLTQGTPKDLRSALMGGIEAAGLGLESATKEAMANDLLAIVRDRLSQDFGPFVLNDQTGYALGIWNAIFPVGVKKS